MNSKVITLEDWEERQNHTLIFSLGGVYYYYYLVTKSEFLLRAYYVLDSAQVCRSWLPEEYIHSL